MLIPDTIEDQIKSNEGKLVGHRKLNSFSFIHNKDNDSYIKFPFNALYSKYKDFFDKVTYRIELNEKEQVRYRFAPKRMSLDVYGITDYWSLILYLNDSPSITDFEPKSVRLVLNDQIENFINELRILNEK